VAPPTQIIGMTFFVPGTLVPGCYIAETAEKRDKRGKSTGSNQVPGTKIRLIAETAEKRDNRHTTDRQQTDGQLKLAQTPLCWW
jgi:hypothetical protein